MASSPGGDSLPPLSPASSSSGGSVRSTASQKKTRLSALYDNIAPSRTGSFARIFSIQVRTPTVETPASPSSLLPPSPAPPSSFTYSSPTAPVQPAGPNALFGMPLPTEPAKLRDGVPLVVQRCVTYLLQHGTGTEGVFRVAASVAEMRNIKGMYDRGEDPPLQETARSPHAVAGLLKMYFRELPEPLLTSEYYEMFVSSAGIPVIDERLKRLRNVIEYMPKPNLDTLHYLVCFLRLLVAFRDKTKMDAGNLATVLAPNILRTRHSMAEEVKDAPLVALVLVHLIEDFDFIFAGNPGPKPPTDGMPSPKGVTAPISIGTKRQSSKTALFLTPLDPIPTVTISSPEPDTATTPSTATPMPVTPQSSTGSVRNSVDEDVPITSPPKRLDEKMKRRKERKSDAYKTDPNKGSTRPVIGDHDAGDDKSLMSIESFGRRRNSSAAGAKNRPSRSTTITKSASAKDLRDNKILDAASPETLEFLLDVQNFRAEIVSKKIRAGNVDIDGADSKGNTALMFAALTDDTEMVALLIGAGCDINKRNERGETALYCAASSGSVESAKRILEAGADIHQADNEGRSPIIIAAYEGEKKMCHMLLQRGAYVNDRDRLTQKTPLVLAAYAGRLDVCELLVNNGAEVNAVDAFGWSALMMAAFTGQDAVASLLMQHKASVTVSTKKGKTAAVIAGEAGYADLAAKLSNAPAPTKPRRRTASATSPKVSEREPSL